MSQPTRSETFEVEEKRIPYRWRRWAKQVVFAVLLMLSTGVLLFPMFWMFSTALRKEGELFTRGVQLLPETWSLENYTTLFTLTDFTAYYVNSVLVAIGVVGLTTLLSTLGGYGLARVDIPYKSVLARGVLIGYMFPAIMLGIPMYIIWRQIGLLNSYAGLILAETALSLPFSLWLMWKFFQTIPTSLEESAQMMGATRFGAFFDIALPMSKPGVIAVAIFSYAVSWNAYTIPKIILTDSSRWVLTIGIQSFTESEQIFWGQIMAASSLVIIPAFVFVYFLQKYMLRGFRAGNVG